MSQKLSVVIPAYNESPTIHLILDKVLQVDLMSNLDLEVVIVDDCSKYGTYEVIQKYIEQLQTNSISLYRHKKNPGKGAAFHDWISKERLIYGFQITLKNLFYQMKKNQIYPSILLKVNYL